MKIHPYLYWLPLLALLFNSCTRYAYYQSPFHNNTASYKAMPLYSDSVRSAVYAQAGFTTGGANYQKNDGTNGGIASIYRTHTSEHLQAFYGVTGMLGNYHVNPYHGDTYNHNLDTAAINRQQGGKFYGGWGATAGISLNLPFDKHEWRLGGEVNWLQEFGDYYNFRKSLPDSAANIISPRKNYLTTAITSDLVFRVEREMAIGWKMALVYSPIRLKGFDANRYPYSKLPFYMSQTIHLTWKQLTFYSQLNTGTYAFNCQFGLNYQLARSRR